MFVCTYSTCFFFLMIRRPPRSTRLTHSFPTRRSSDLIEGAHMIQRSGNKQPRFCRQAEYNHMFSAFDVEILVGVHHALRTRSEEHTSELQSLMRISYAVFCLKKKTNHYIN